MKVQIIARISGLRNGVDWPAPGEFLTLPDGEAKDIIDAGIARMPEAAPETATARKAETATRKGASPKGR